MIQVEEPKKAESTGRVLIYIPVGEDVSTIRGILAGLAVEGVICTDIQDLCQRVMREDTSAVLLAESALTDGALPLLAEALQMQPSWSDLPILFVASGGPESPLAVQAMQDLPNVLVFDRPVRLATLAGALRMALRIRDKQRQVRDLLEERQRREEALRRSEERYRFLVESVNDWVWEVDRGSVYTYVGPQCRELLGYEPEEIVGKTPYDLMPPEEARRIREVFESIVSQAKPFRQLENVNRRKDGRLVVLETNGVPVRDAQGNLAGYRGIGRDITDRKRAEEALRESEERLHRAMESGKVGVWEWEVGTDNVQWSQGVYPLLGCKPDEVTPSLKAIRQRIDPRDLAHHDEALKDSLERCEDYLGEFRVVWADGSVHWLAARGQYVYVDTPRGTILRLRGVFSDIDRRKQAEESLRRSEEQFHRLFEEDLTGDFLSAPDGRIFLCNPAFATTFGFSHAADAVGTSLAELYLDPGELESLVERLARERKIERLEVWRKRRDGQPIHLVENLVGRFNEQGQLYEIKGYTFEDTQRKQAQEALRESEEKYRRIVETATEGIVMADTEARMIFVNDRWSEIFGYSPEEAKHVTLVDLVFPEDRTRMAERWESRKRGQKERYEFRFRRKDGSPVWLLVGVAPRLDPEGEFLGTLVMATDITERKQAEETMRRSEERLHLALGAARMGVWQWEVGTQHVTWSPELYGLLGYEPGRVTPTHEAFRRRIHPQDLTRWQQAMRESMERCEDYACEFRVVWADGSVHWVEARGQYVYSRDESATETIWMRGVLSDIEQRKRAEEALHELTRTLESRVAQRTAELKHRTRQLQRLALEMSKSEDQERERLAQILHDDLQQELAAAKFHLSVVRSRIKYDPSVQEITARVDEMLKDAIGKSRNLSHELSPAVLHQDDFAEILRGLANEMQAKHGLAVHVQGRARVPSDPIKAFLYRTAQELLFNAVKHAQVQEARVRVRQCGGYVCLAVSDRGRGFDPEKLREVAGFGLLSIRERIELLGGRMKIRSAPGRGSTFFVIVPNSETAAPLNGRAEGAERSTAQDDGRLRVVLADDHDIVRQGLAALLSEEDTVKIVGEAANGREAVELAERLRPDVVVMDVRMPVMSGEEATRRIKQELPQTRVVSLSMREEPQVREKMRAAGAESYVLKTAPYKELLAAIRGQSENEMQGKSTP
jgi:PAS domain S-box-containing protein